MNIDLPLKIIKNLFFLFFPNFISAAVLSSTILIFFFSTTVTKIIGLLANAPDINASLV